MTAFMTMGQRIAALRARHHLSQEELAERLDVSRQSVSKWETDASIPDLAKLLALSEVFGVTLDELVKGTPAPAAPVPDPAPPTPAPEPAAPAARPLSTQRILGVVFVAAGLVSVILGVVVSGILLALGLLLLYCGLVCLLVRRHAGLVIGWPVWLLYRICAPMMIGYRAYAIFHPMAYANLTYPVDYLLLGIGWSAFAVFALLVFFTVRAVRAAVRRRSETAP